MIRVPAIAIHRPWPLPSGRRQAERPASTITDKAERAMVRERVNTFADAEHTAILSASVNGQRLL